MQTQEPLVSVRELAQFLNVRPLTVYRAVYQKKIPVVRVSSRALRFDRAEVLAALRQEGRDDER